MMERQLYANKTSSRTNLISAEFLPESTKQDFFLTAPNSGALLKFILSTGTAMNVAELFALVLLHRYQKPEWNFSCKRLKQAVHATVSRWNSNYEKEIRNTIQYKIELVYVSSLSGNNRCIIYLAASSLSTENVHKFGQVFGKIKNYNSKYLNGLQEPGNQAHEISHVPNVLHNHAGTADHKFSIAANPMKKPLSFWFLFWLHKHLLKYNTVRIPYCIHILEIFIPSSPTPYFSSQIINHSYLCTHTPTFILKYNKNNQVLLSWNTVPCLHCQHIIAAFLFYYCLL